MNAAIAFPNIIVLLASICFFIAAISISNEPEKSRITINWPYLGMGFLLLAMSVGFKL